MAQHRQNSSGRRLLYAFYVHLTVVITAEGGGMETEGTYFYYRPALAYFPCVEKRKVNYYFFIYNLNQQSEFTFYKLML
jgi:hypothetical protein